MWWAMAIWAAATLPRIFGTNRGPTFLWEALESACWVWAMVVMPFMAVPITMPVRSGVSVWPASASSAAR